jgi:D-alanyl-D-alanine dipeptidase
MKYVWSIFFLIVPLFHLSAQSNYPHRTPENVARKQTEMMVRELGIQDCVLKDSIYRMHLKYAYRRASCETRGEVIQCIQDANEELKQILTPEQYQRFMSQQINHQPHRPHKPCHQIIHHNGAIPPPHEHGATIDTLAMPPDFPQ